VAVIVVLFRLRQYCQTTVERPCAPRKFAATGPATTRQGRFSIATSAGLVPDAADFLSLQRHIAYQAMLADHECEYRSLQRFAVVLRTRSF